MKKWKMAASIVIVFLLGALAGTLVTHTLSQRKVERIIRGETRSAGEFIVRRLSHKLDLDGAQQEQLKAIIEATHAEINALRKQYRPQIEEILTHSQDKVRAILRPDQREKYEKIISEHRKRKENRENNR